MWTKRGGAGFQPARGLSGLARAGLEGRPRPGRPPHGGALLTVLWLSAALSAIALSLAGTVRSEIERAATALDATRAYYLATGAIERAILYMDWGAGTPRPDGSPQYYAPWVSVLRFQFPTGEAVVEIIPEAGKVNLNFAPPEELYNLLAALGAEPERAREIALAILDWRTHAPGLTEFDQYYLGLTPSFRSRHTSFEEIEEVLLVKGMTPDLFYGGYTADAQGVLQARPGFRDCVTVLGAPGRVNVNTAPPALLVAVGVPPDVARMIVEMRRQAGPFRSLQQVATLVTGPPLARLSVGGGSIYTLRATARLRLADGNLSDARRSVAAMIKRLPPGWDRTYHVLRWYENAWTPAPAM